MSREAPIRQRCSKCGYVMARAPQQHAWRRASWRIGTVFYYWCRRCQRLSTRRIKHGRWTARD